MKKSLFTVVVAVVSMFIADSAFADWYMDLNVACYHFDRNVKDQLHLNEVNPGIGFENDTGEVKYMGGVYKNSFSHQSVYLLAAYMPYQNETGSLKAGVVGGGITGYIMRVTPAIGVMASYTYKSVGVNLIAVPSASVQGMQNYGFIGLQAFVKL